MCIPKLFDIAEKITEKLIGASRTKAELEHKERQLEQDKRQFEQEKQQFEQDKRQLEQKKRQLEQEAKQFEREIQQDKLLKIESDIEAASKAVSYMLIASDDSRKIKALQAISPLRTCGIEGVRIAANELYDCIHSENGFTPNTERINRQFDKFIAECNKSLYGFRKTSTRV